MFPPLLLKPPDADMQWQETKKWSAKGFNFIEDDRALVL